MQKYEVRTGDLRSSILVGRSDGASAEFLLAETYDRLEKVRQRDSAAWDGPRLFEELEQCLRGKALGAFRDNVAREYPTDAEKTATNYDMLKKDILTTLTDRTYPGDSVHDYITSEISYLKCKDEKGNVDKPSHFLARMRQLRDFGARMHHNQGTTFLSERDFLAAVWRAFPDEMQEWLTIEHRIDPFDTNNPLDADEVCDHMHGYWFQRLQPKVSKTSSRGRGDVSGDVADVDDVDGEDDEENGNEDERKPPARADADRRARSRRRGDEDHQDVEADGDGSGRAKKAARSTCPIDGHAKYQHGWDGCFLNPRSARFNPSSAEHFYQTQCHGCNSWYKDTYEAMLARSEEHQQHHFHAAEDYGP